MYIHNCILIDNLRKAYVAACKARAIVNRAKDNKAKRDHLSRIVSRINTLHKELCYYEAMPLMHGVSYHGCVPFKTMVNYREVA